MPLRRALVALLWAMLGAPLAAQQQITPESFLDRAVGRTLTFETFPDNQLVGVEQFLSRTRTVWTTATGTCTYGEIELRGPLICFIYRDLPRPEHCWTPFEAEGRLYVVSTDGALQQISRITDRPVICQDVPIS